MIVKTSSPRRADALVDAVDGQGGGDVADLGVADLAGVRAQADVVEGCRQIRSFDKVRDVVGLYMNPPEAAVVLCVDTQVHRTAPILPLMPGTQRRTRLPPLRHHQPVRRARHKVISSMAARHRAESSASS